MELTLQIKELVLDNEYQKRVNGINMETVEEYAVAIGHGESFPPITVFDTEDGYIVVDGFHRVAAYRISDYDSILCDVKIGTIQEAYDYARFEANRRNGMRLSKSDQTKIVEEVIRDPRFSQTSSRELAELIGVSNSTVSRLRKVLDLTPTTIIGQDGKLYNGPDALSSQLPTTEELDTKLATQRKNRRILTIKTRLNDIAEMRNLLNKRDYSELKKFKELIEILLDS